MAAVVFSAATAAAMASDCYFNPAVCLLNESCEVLRVGSVSIGRCVPLAPVVDCYRYPGTCGADEWCQLRDHVSWGKDENTTEGRCVPYAAECHACTPTLEDSSPPVIPGLDAARFHGGPRGGVGGFGEYVRRGTRCAPGLACSGPGVPSLPFTCVRERPVVEGDAPSRRLLTQWAQRMLRMGARSFRTPQPGAGVQSQLPQGATRQQIRDGVNFMLRTLWPEALGRWPGNISESTEGLLCCHDPRYTAGLTDFQRARGGPEFRNPLNPHDAVQGNAPPCLWCSFDGAYNDENPTIWKVIHTLTFNLPATVSPAQRAVLQWLPLWLREHLSCPLCRGKVKEHVIDLGIPETWSGDEWARFYWNAHNYVSEQTEVTRCGSQGCGWGIWSTPASRRCAGSYRYPWFMSLDTARRQWQLS